MLFNITPHKTIGALRHEFSEYFPYLTLEFYDQPHKNREASNPGSQYPHDTCFASIMHKNPSDNIEIHSWYKTGEVEQVFKMQLGLNVQVCRRQRDAWLQTTATDRLTLEAQNELGRKACENLHHPDYSTPLEDRMG
jgi:hypothetical protein